jgi:hypothetical protein
VVRNSWYGCAPLSVQAIGAIIRTNNTHHGGKNIICIPPRGVIRRASRFAIVENGVGSETSNDKFDLDRWRQQPSSKSERLVLWSCASARRYAFDQFRND